MERNVVFWIYTLLFDREQRSKVLKEALLLLFLLTWGKHEQKMFHMEQKWSTGTKKCSFKILDEHKSIKALYVQRVICLELFFVAYYDIELPRVAL